MSTLMKYLVNRNIGMYLKPLKRGLPEYRRLPQTTADLPQTRLICSTSVCR